MNTIFALVANHNCWMDRKEIIQSFTTNQALVTKIWVGGKSVAITEDALRQALLNSETVELVQCEKRLKLVFKRIAGNEYEWAILPT
jgi:hypothetical protein